MGLSRWPVCRIRAPPTSPAVPSAWRPAFFSVDKLPPECRSVTRRKLTQIEALERDAIVRSLQDNGGNKQEAARALVMSRATIYRKINDYGIA